MLLQENLEFGLLASRKNETRFKHPLVNQLARFKEFGKETKVVETRTKSFAGECLAVPTYINEYWTSKQRAANSLHEISYRACFKPQLPRFFIERLTEPGETVYDPFMGRGTTLVEAALLNRVPLGCDVNPLSVFLTRPRLRPPTLTEVKERLSRLRLKKCDEAPKDLLVFYHPETLKEICALRKHLLERQESGELDHVDEWIWMVALNRLTGHSPGFLSVYTMPPNQAVSAKAQKKINETRGQIPPRRHITEIILKKTRKLLSDCDQNTLEQLSKISRSARLLTKCSDATEEIADESVALVVTSPPFLDVVDYANDNWLRCWFIGVESEKVKLTVPKRLEDWQQSMTGAFKQFNRILKPGGHVAFEVGEIRGGRVRLEEAVVPCGVEAGLHPLLILINDQKFTKTANCWGVDNNSKGTNTNRIVVFQKQRHT